MYVKSGSDRRAPAVAISADRLRSAGTEQTATRVVTLFAGGGM